MLCPKHLLRTAVVAVAALLVSGTGLAETTDFGLWLTIGGEKKLDGRWTLSAEGAFRTRDNSQTVDRWDVSFSGEYKPVGWLKIMGGYQLRYTHNREKLSLDSEGNTTALRPTYWDVRHMFNLNLIGSVDFGRVTLSVRERWQYVYRPEKTTVRYTYADECWEDVAVSGHGTNVLCSRFRVTYKPAAGSVTPYADIELFNKWELQKMRYTVGAEWKLSTSNSLSAFYRYIDNNTDGSEADRTHILGIGYKFRF